MSEYRRVLARPQLHIRKGLRLQFLQLIRNRGHVVVPTRRVQAASDPDDNIFLECAEAAKADYLITGNLRHFPKFWKQTEVISTREFMAMVAPHLVS